MDIKVKGVENIDIFSAGSFATIDDLLKFGDQHISTLAGELRQMIVSTSKKSSISLAETAKMQEKIENLKKKLNDANTKDIKQLEEQNSELSKKFAESQAAVQKLTQQLAKATASNTDLQNELIEAKAEYDALNAKYKNKLDVIAKLKQLQKKYTEDLKNATSGLNQVKAKYEAEKEVILQRWKDFLVQVRANLQKDVDIPDKFDQDILAEGATQTIIEQLKLKKQTAAKFESDNYTYITAMEIDSTFDFE